MTIHYIITGDEEVFLIYTRFGIFTVSVFLRGKKREKKHNNNNREKMRVYTPSGTPVTAAASVALRSLPEHSRRVCVTGVSLVHVCVCVFVRVSTVMATDKKSTFIISLHCGVHSLGCEFLMNPRVYQ